MIQALAVFLPLIGAALAGLGGRWLGDRGSMAASCGSLALAALCGIFLLWDVAIEGHTRTIELYTWISSGSFEAGWSLRFDQLTAVMVFVVTFVSCAVHFYSIGYMAHDHSKPRFFAYLSLFTFFMLALVTSDNFLQLFFGWEGVGLCSYFLIGFWYDRPSANAAAIKAFLVNRIGDFGFALGIMGVFLVFELDLLRHRVRGRTRQGPGHDGVPGLPRADHDDAVSAAVHRRHGQIGPGSTAHLAARRDGGPDAGLGAHSRRHHGDRRRVHGRAAVADVRIRARRARRSDHRRCLHRLLCRDHRHDPDRHQARDRVFDVQPARLHVLRLRRFRLSGGDLPFDDPRLLQGAIVPRRRLGDPRHVGRAGHAQDGRALSHDPAYLRGDVDRLACTRRNPSIRGLLLQGHHPGKRVGRTQLARRIRVLDGHRRGVHDGVLFLAPHLPHLPRREPRRRKDAGPRARISAHHDGAADRARHRRCIRRHDRLRGHGRRVLAGLLGQVDPHPAGTRRTHECPSRAGMGQRRAARRRARRHRHRLARLYREPRAAGHPCGAVPRALPVSPEQVVLRRAVRLPVRPAGTHPRLRPVEAGRRRGDRRSRAGRNRRRDARTWPRVRAGCRPATSTTTPSQCSPPWPRWSPGIWCAANERGLADPEPRHVPAAGGRGVHFPGAWRRGDRRTQRAGDGAVDLTDHLCAVDPAVDRFQHQDRRLPVRRNGRMDSVLQHSLQDGGGRHLGAFRAAVDVPHAALRARLVARHHRARQGIHDRVPGARDADGRACSARSTWCCSTCSGKAC